MKSDSNGSMHSKTAQVGPKKRNWESLWAPFTEGELGCRHDAPAGTEEVCEEATNCIDAFGVLVRAAGCLSVSFSWTHSLHSTEWTTCIPFFDKSVWNTNLQSCISFKTNKQTKTSLVNCMVKKKVRTVATVLVYNQRSFQGWCTWALCPHQDWWALRSISNCSERCMLQAQNPTSPLWVVYRSFQFPDTCLGICNMCLGKCRGIMIHVLHSSCLSLIFLVSTLDKVASPWTCLHQSLDNIGILSYFSYVTADFLQWVLCKN